MKIDKLANLMLVKYILTIGSTIRKLEEQNLISFTNGYDFDYEMFDLSFLIIIKWITDTKITEHNFSLFVEKMLLKEQERVSQM